jgi:hypothetical protein
VVPVAGKPVAEELQHLGESSVEIDLVPAGQSMVSVASEGPLAGQAVAAALDEAGGYRLAGV